MPPYRSVGSVPAKRHTQHRDSSGKLYFEELMGEEGFSSTSALLYHRAIPSAIIDTRPWPLPDLATVPNHPLRPRHLRLPALFGDAATRGTPPAVDVVLGRRLIVANGDVRVSYVAASSPSPAYRNAVSDECIYVESGEAIVESVFGSLRVGDGDYVLLPRGTTHRWIPAAGRTVRALCIETNGHLAPPARYLSRYGQFLEHSPYCERDLRSPQPDPDTGSSDAGPVDVYVKHRGAGPLDVAGSILTGATTPFDVVGWDGCLYPYAFNVRDFEPITGRVHQPPPVHQFIAATNVVICNFVPRRVDYHPQSIPAPYYHANVDSDEVIFYCRGNYAARSGSGIGSGSISLHPSGFTHGPQPGAYERSIGVDAVDELAVMIDTFRPLHLGEGALACDDPGYAWSWAQRAGPTEEERASATRAGDPDTTAR